MPSSLLPIRLTQAFVISEVWWWWRCSFDSWEQHLLWKWPFRTCEKAAQQARTGRCHSFCITIDDPERLALLSLLELQRYFRSQPIQESNYALTGYLFLWSACCWAGLVVSTRGEYEITDLNRLYLDDGRLMLLLLVVAVAGYRTWSLFEASTFCSYLLRCSGLP